MKYFKLNNINILIFFFNLSKKVSLKKEIGFYKSFLSIFILASLFINLNVDAKNNKIVLDKIIAKINDQVIFESDLNQSLIQYLAYYGGDKEKAKVSVLKNLVKTKLFISKANKNIDIDQNIINVYYKDKLKQILLKYDNSEAKLEKNAKISMNELRKIIKKNITESYIMEYFKAKITRNVTVSRSDVINYLNSSKKNKIPKHNKQIVLKRIVKHLHITEKEKQNIMKLMNKLKEKIRNGQDFSKLAKKYSDDIESAKNGGDIGYEWDPNESFLPQKYIDAATKLSPIETSTPPYDTSNIIETPFGMYLIQLIKRRGNTYRTRHIFIKPKDIEGQKNFAFKYLNDIKSKILNKSKSIDQYINSIDKKSSDFKYSGYMKNQYGNIRFEKYKDKLPWNLNQKIFSLSPGFIIGPNLINTEEGSAMHIIYIDNILEQRIANIQYDFDEISKMILSNKKDKKIKEWITKNKNESLIYFDNQYKKYENQIWK